MFRAWVSQQIPLYGLIICYFLFRCAGGVALDGESTLEGHHEMGAHSTQRREKIASQPAWKMLAEAFWGEPFGVARVTLTVPPDGLPLGPQSLLVSCPQNRVFYPAVQEGPLQGLIREKSGRTLGRYHVYFLFAGKEPLEVQIRCWKALWTVRLVPEENARRRNRVLAEWYQALASPRQVRESDLSAWIKRYLQTMLIRRLGLNAQGDSEPNQAPKRPGRPQSRSGGWERVLGPELGWLLAAQDLKAHLFFERAEGRSQRWSQPAKHPLPPPPPLSSKEFPEGKALAGSLEPKKPPEIEPIATRVPKECFYIRLGSMAEFAWFRQLLDWAWREGTLWVGGKALEAQWLERAEQRLCLRPSGWSQLLGPQLGGQVENLAVADVALIGLDLFQPEGSALGVLFQARSEPLLRAELQRQRAEALRKGQGNLQEQKLQIEGREVSLLRSKDGRIRSFYVVDGPWHLVSTSGRLVERFLQTRSGQGALAQLPEFRTLRTKYPPAPDQTAFCYFSQAFWQTQWSPAYQVERHRRMKAEVDVLLVELARQAALAEGRPADSIETLVAEGFLPSEFGPRTDGSQAVLKDGQVWDLRRGPAGYFLPIADIEVAELSDSERKQLERDIQRISEAGNRLGPTLILFRRREVQKGMEQIDIEIYVYISQPPFWQKWGRWFGSVSADRIVPPPGDEVFLEWKVPQGRVFFGLRAKQPAEVRLGRGKLLMELLPTGLQLVLQALRVGYVGREGQTPLLETVEKLVAGRPDPAGYTGRAGGLWRREIGPFRLYSFDRQLLAEVGPLLRLEQTDQPAQLRLYIPDPSKTSLGQWIFPLASQQAQEATQANLRLLTMLENHFHLSGQAALDTAHRWLQAQLVCPLGGQYEYRHLGQAGWHWVATALPEPAKPKLPLSQPPQPHSGTEKTHSSPERKNGSPRRLPSPSEEYPPSLEQKVDTDRRQEIRRRPNSTRSGAIAKDGQRIASGESLGRTKPPRSEPLEWFRGLEAQLRWENHHFQLSLRLVRTLASEPSRGRNSDRPRTARSSSPSSLEKIAPWRQQTGFLPLAVEGKIQENKLFGSWGKVSVGRKGRPSWGLFPLQFIFW